MPFPEPRGQQASVPTSSCPPSLCGPLCAPSLRLSLRPTSSISLRSWERGKGWTKIRSFKKNKMTPLAKSFFHPPSWEVLFKQDIFHCSLPLYSPKIFHLRSHMTMKLLALFPTHLIQLLNQPNWSLIVWNTQNGILNLVLESRMPRISCLQESQPPGAVVGIKWINICWVFRTVCDTK